MGNLLSCVDYDGSITSYEYDAYDRLILVTKNGEVIGGTYDAVGRLVTVSYGDNVVSYTYDSYNRVQSRSDAFGNTVTYGYDAYGRVAEISAYRNQDGVAEMLSQTRYGYNAYNQLITVTDENGGVTEYQYDLNGNPVKMIYPDGMEVLYTYDVCGRLTSETVKRGTEELVSYAYTYGSRNECLSITERRSNLFARSSEVTTVYTYDALLRLVGETLSDGTGELSYIYTYDSVGNRLSKEITVSGDISGFTGSTGEIIENEVVTYTYNELNQLITETSEGGANTYTYDENGNLTSLSGEKQVSYTYNSLGYLAEATITSGGVTTWESYTYDGEGNRISVTVRGGGRLEPETTYYVNDACSSLTQVLATTDAYGNRMESTVRGLGLIASIGEETTYFVTDAKGSVTALIQDGVVTDAYRYDAYGNLIERSGNSSDPYRYNGEAYSEETGLYYQRARYMNPETGTFISMDAYSGTLGNPVSQHKYLYANANPVMYEDASGYSPFVEAVLGQGLKTILSGIRTLQTAVSLAKAGMSWIQLLGMGFIGSIGAMVDSGLGGASKFDMVMAMLRGFGIGVLGFTFMSALSYLSASVRALSALFESISSLAGGIVAARDSYEEGKYEQAAFRMLMGIFGCIMGARDYRNALRDCNVSVVVDETPNGGGGRGCVGEESGAPSGFYQDVNGRWHRPNGQFASNAEVGITSPTKVSTGSHGNSLSDPRTNYGYVLVDRNTNEILKFGETIHSTTRYSKSYLDANNANMMILEQGNKLDIHLWQHDMNEYYFYNYNEYPPLNSGGW